LFSCQHNDDKIYPEITSVTESVYASATIQPDSLYEVYSAVGGIVDLVLVEEGDLVSKNTALFHIVNNTSELNRQNAKLAYDLAQENYIGSAAILGEIEDEITSARLSFKNDSINFCRQENLWEQQIGSKVEYDSKKLAYELSENRLKLLESKYERTKQELSTILLQSKNNYESANIQNLDFTIKSVIEGKVYDILKKQGEIVTSMEPIAVLGSSDVFVIELLVDEVDIVKLRRDQDALITLDAYGDELFKAKIYKIYPRKNERSQTFKVEARFNNPPEVLYPGLAGESNIIISKKENALTIPKAYLVDGNFVITENGKTEVVLGLENLNRVEIIEGIDSQTALLKPN